MLARFSRLPDVESTPPQSENRKQLHDLLSLRTMLIKQRGALQQRPAEPELDDSDGPATSLAADAKACTDCERRIRACSAALAWRDAIIQSIPGLGPVTSATRWHPDSQADQDRLTMCDKPLKAGPGGRHPQAGQPA